jgi:hypothetical protein
MGGIAVIIVIGSFGKLFYSKISFYIHLIASYWQTGVKEDTFLKLGIQDEQTGLLETKLKKIFGISYAVLAIWNRVTVSRAIILLCNLNEPPWDVWGAIYYLPCQYSSNVMLLWKIYLLSMTSNRILVYHKRCNYGYNAVWR